MMHRTGESADLCLDLLLKRCLHYHTCTAYIYGMHVLRTCMIV